MEQVTVTLPDGSHRDVPTGAVVRDIANTISPSLAKSALAAVVNDELVDLSYPVAVSYTHLTLPTKA